MWHLSVPGTVSPVKHAWSLCNHRYCTFIIQPYMSNWLVLTALMVASGDEPQRGLVAPHSKDVNKLTVACLAPLAAHGELAGMGWGSGGLTIEFTTGCFLGRGCCWLALVTNDLNALLRSKFC